MRELPAFELERFLRANEPRALFAIGGSGAPRGDLAPYLAGLDDAWARSTDDLVAEMRAAVAEQFGCASGEVLPTVGASEADMLAVLALAGAGGHVVVEQPAYHALIQPALALGCRVTRVQRRAEDAYALDAARVADALATDTRLVVLSRPNNPTGGDADVRAIADAAARVGALVLVDEVFADATRMGDRSAALAHDAVVAVSSLTKCLGFSGLRAGWAIARPDVVERLDRAKALVSVQNGALDLALGARVLRDRQRLVEATRVARAQNALLLASLLRAHGVRARIPDHGTTLALPIGGDDVAFARALLDQRRTLVAPGSFVEMPGFIRLGLLAPGDTWRAGLERLSAALRPG